MLDFEEELAKFQPSMDIEQVEEVVYNNNLTDITDIVKELIQDELTVENITAELTKILSGPAKQLQLKNDYAALRNLLGQGGDASANAAESIWEISKANVQ